MGGPPEILADGIQEAIGLVVGDDGVAYVSDLGGGHIHVVPLPGSATAGDGARLLVELHEPLSGLANEAYEAYKPRNTSSKDTAGFTPVKMFKVMLRTVERRHRPDRHLV